MLLPFTLLTFDNRVALVIYYTECLGRLLYFHGGSSHTGWLVSKAYPVPSTMKIGPGPGSSQLFLNSQATPPVLLIFLDIPRSVWLSP